ncbi:hypothetical protein CVT26_004250 [Gymnopilus dilepis]|uniref:Uncharacterized protein n=1 Tax=Gymnopilus dilepis TaxID=231916 RepID=A0A409W7J4_9AGAR|nr:hypothetical protein CVT26_004250 [Gymnopilus dilepis]
MRLEPPPPICENIQQFHLPPLPTNPLTHEDCISTATITLHTSRRRRLHFVKQRKRWALVTTNTRLQHRQSHAPHLEPLCHRLPKVAAAARQAEGQGTGKAGLKRMRMSTVSGELNPILRLLSLSPKTTISEDQAHRRIDAHALLWRRRLSATRGMGGGVLDERYRAGVASKATPSKASHILV